MPEGVGFLEFVIHNQKTVHWVFICAAAYDVNSL
jgi:hypothetical protein